MAIITLTTDFGTRDWFVGSMKGVIAGIAPKARVIDLNHEIRPGDLWGGAFSLLCSYAFFPAGTIHVVVVDPGVGSARKAIAVRTSRYMFIGPDNGVLSWALRKERVLSTRALQNSEYFLKDVSQTFHGRDVFSPVAAHLARGVRLGDLGPALKVFVRLEWPDIKRTKGALEGQVVHIDRFGNAITNIPNPAGTVNKEMLCAFGAKQQHRVSYGASYSAVPRFKAVLVRGSTGYLEIAVNGGSAEKALRLKRGSPVRLNIGARPRRFGPQRKLPTVSAQMPRKRPRS